MDVRIIVVFAYRNSWLNTFTVLLFLNRIKIFLFTRVKLDRLDPIEPDPARSNRVKLDPLDPIEPDPARSILLRLGNISLNKINTEKVSRLEKYIY